MYNPHPDPDKDPRFLKKYADDTRADREKFDILCVPFTGDPKRDHGRLFKYTSQTHITAEGSGTLLTTEQYWCMIDEITRVGLRNLVYASYVQIFADGSCNCWLNVADDNYATHRASYFIRVRPIAVVQEQKREQTTHEQADHVQVPGTSGTAG